MDYSLGNEPEYDQGDYHCIGGLSGGEMYEWWVMDALYNKKTGRYHLYMDSGCSCNYAYDEVWDPGQPYDKDELIKEINSHRNDGGYAMPEAQEYVELAQKVRTFDPNNFKEK